MGAHAVKWAAVAVILEWSLPGPAQQCRLSAFTLTIIILRIKEKNESQETSSLTHLLLFLFCLWPSSSLRRQLVFQLAGSLLLRGSSHPTTVKIRVLFFFRNYWKMGIFWIVPEEFGGSALSKCSHKLFPVSGETDIFSCKNHLKLARAYRDLLAIM